jgi:cell division inhibitor SepF
MSLGDLWSRTLVYFGIAEEDDEFYDDEDGYSAEQSLEQSYRERPNVRRLTPRRRTPGLEDWTDSNDDYPPSRSPARTPAPSPPPTPRRSRAVAAGPRHIEAVPSGAVRVSLVVPRSFNDAQQVADKYKHGNPVILNLQEADTELGKRLMDFLSGLVYGLDGSIQRIAEKVFLLSPRNVEVSAEQRAQLLERGGFYNQG